MNKLTGKLGYKVGCSQLGGSKRQFVVFTDNPLTQLIPAIQQTFAAIVYCSNMLNYSTLPFDLSEQEFQENGLLVNKVPDTENFVPYVLSPFDRINAINKLAQTYNKTKVNYLTYYIDIVNDEPVCTTYPVTAHTHMYSDEVSGYNSRLMSTLDRKDVNFYALDQFFAIFVSQLGKLL